MAISTGQQDSSLIRWAWVTGQGFYGTYHGCSENEPYKQETNTQTVESMSFRKFKSKITEWYPKAVKLELGKRSWTILRELSYMITAMKGWGHKHSSLHRDEHEDVQHPPRVCGQTNTGTEGEESTEVHCLQTGTTGPCLSLLWKVKSKPVAIDFRVCFPYH